MIILGIETSCDETALCIVEIEETKNANASVSVKILANQVLSQIAIHKQYGGVFPMVAKREHAKNLIPLLKKVLEEAGFLDSRMGIANHSDVLNPPERTRVRSVRAGNIRIDWTHDEELKKAFFEFIPTIEKPKIDMIAVTCGPGLEPCLWTGLNFAKALSVAWNIPAVPANHMEGHILVSLLKRNEENPKHEIRNPKEDLIPNSSFIIHSLSFPALALLISGGHTEIVLMKKWLDYEIVGRTRDDAVGEAFDKVARILGLPYPGGPEISALAEQARKSPDLQLTTYNLQLPRPMIHSDNLDFSFSGLKTAVLYLVQKLTQTDPASVREGLRPVSISSREQSLIALEFEDSATEVIIEKIKKAVEIYGIQTLILGGGVVANKHIRGTTEKLAREQNITLKLPEIDNATDNALMITLAGYFNRDKALTEKTGLLEVKADGNLHF